MNRLNIFRHAETRDAEAGQTIFKAGEPGDLMYAIVEGTVDIKEGDVLFDTLGPGDIFGEMALIDKSPRSATAVARTAVKLAQVDQIGFERLVAQTPYFALDVMAIMAERIRRANVRIAQATEVARPPA